MEVGLRARSAHRPPALCGGKAPVLSASVTRDLESLRKGCLLWSQPRCLEHKYHWEERHLELLLGIGIFGEGRCERLPSVLAVPLGRRARAFGWEVGEDEDQDGVYTRYEVGALVLFAF